MNILIIDIGGNHVKLWKSDHAEKIKLPSGKELTPGRLIAAVRSVIEAWPAERVSVGVPTEVKFGMPVAEPVNLGTGWVGFDFEDAFQRPTRVMNDGAMQALGSYKGGKMLFLGFGTGIGSTLIVDGKIVPLALGYLKLHGNKTIDECLSDEGFKELGEKKWTNRLFEAVKMLRMALQVDYVVLGGGNADELVELPEGCLRGGNEYAYFGGLRMWEEFARYHA